jgi:hypothetical protein
VPHYDVGQGIRIILNCTRGIVLSHPNESSGNKYFLVLSWYGFISRIQGDDPLLNPPFEVAREFPDQNFQKDA